MQMNDDAILATVIHRPFPLPESPPVLRQSWSKLLFAHWPVDAGVLRPLIPDCLEMDLFEGTAYLGVVPFAMRKVHPRFTPDMGWLSNFLELNIRTYVKKDGIPGVYFFSLDCNNPVAVTVARTTYHLPYFNARMTMDEQDSLIKYESKRLNCDAVFQANYKSAGAVLKLSPASLDRFLTERYCLYTTDRRGRCFRGVIHHLMWQLQPAEAEIITDTLSSTQLGFQLPDTKPLLHYSEYIDTLEWPLAKLD